jgi:hypothetical protein
LPLISFCFCIDIPVLDISYELNLLLLCLLWWTSLSKIFFKVIHIVAWISNSLPFFHFFLWPK